MRSSEHCECCENWIKEKWSVCFATEASITKRISWSKAQDKRHDIAVKLQFIFFNCVSVVFFNELCRRCCCFCLKAVSMKKKFIIPSTFHLKSVRQFFIFVNVFSKDLLFIVVKEYFFLRFTLKKRDNNGENISTILQLLLYYTKSSQEYILYLYFYRLIHYYYY